MQPWGEGSRAGSRRKPVDKLGRSWERQNKKSTSSGEEPMRMTKMERTCTDYCHGGKMGRNPSKYQSLIKKRTGSKLLLTKIPKVTNPRKGKKTGKWEIVLI